MFESLKYLYTNLTSNLIRFLQNLCFFYIVQIIYGVKKNKSVNHLDKPRTNFEIKITRLALKKNKPILGICGGQQLLNVVLGGTLIQHIPDEIENAINLKKLVIWPKIFWP